jgi:hypothetical protein
MYALCSVAGGHGIGKFVFLDDLSSFSDIRPMKTSSLAATRGRPDWSQEHHTPTLRTLRTHNPVDTGRQSGHRVRKVSPAPRMPQLLLEAKLIIAGGAYGKDSIAWSRDPL